MPGHAIIYFNCTCREQLGIIMDQVVVQDISLYTFTPEPMNAAQRMPGLTVSGQDAIMVVAPWVRNRWSSRLCYSGCMQLREGRVLSYRRQCSRPVKSSSLP
jgi:hypothetical protein